MQSASQVEAKPVSGQKRKRLTCPECGEALHRTHRRPGERAISLVIPLRRYKCHHCGWSGLRVSLRRPHPKFDRKFVTRVALVVLLCLAAIAIAVWMTLRSESGAAAEGVLIFPILSASRLRFTSVSSKK